MSQSLFLLVLRKKWSTFLTFPFTDKLLVPIVFILLGVARLSTLIISFRYYARFLGSYQKIDAFTPVLTTEQTQRARRIGHIVRATANITPWESLCLVQAMVASLLLRWWRVPYILHFGLAKNTDPTDSHPMKAHAWVTAGPVAVTGGRSLFSFAIVGTYISPSNLKDHSR